MKYTKEMMLQHFAQWQQNGLNKRQYCTKVELSYQAFCKFSSMQNVSSGFDKTQIIFIFYYLHLSKTMFHRASHTKKNYTATITFAEKLALGLPTVHVIGAAGHVYFSPRSNGDAVIFKVENNLTGQRGMIDLGGFKSRDDENSETGQVKRTKK